MVSEGPEHVPSYLAGSAHSVGPPPIAMTILVLILESASCALALAPAAVVLALYVCRISTILFGTVLEFVRERTFGGVACEQGGDCHLVSRRIHLRKVRCRWHMRDLPVHLL